MSTFNITGKKLKWNEIKQEMQYKLLLHSSSNLSGAQVAENQKTIIFIIWNIRSDVARCHATDDCARDNFYAARRGGKISDSLLNTFLR